MSLLRFLKKPGGGKSSPLLPTPQSSAEKADNGEVTRCTRKKEVPTRYNSDELRAKLGRHATEKKYTILYDLLNANINSCQIALYLKTAKF